jgi:2,3-bisphosphoglycerate-independent phosphoglycerate mutase
MVSLITILIHKSKIRSCFFLLVFSIYCLCSSILAGAYTEVMVDPVYTPSGMVIVIVDGLGAPYIYPEHTPHSLDGNSLEVPYFHNLSILSASGAKVSVIRAPQTYTEAGHSVLVTGNSQALSDTVRIPMSTIYDVAHDYDYLAFGIMEKGDSSSICDEHDVIVHDASNSMNDPGMIVESSSSVSSDNVCMDIKEIMQEQALKLPAQLQESKQASQERYDTYDRWALTTAAQVVEYMAEEVPDQKYILTVNAGAVDAAGHYRKYDGYIGTIQKLDRDIMPLYQTCTENNIAFIFTADHGMSFTSSDSKGGHQSDTYSGMDEAQMVPFIVHAPDVPVKVLYGEYGQQDIASTVLSILNLPNGLKKSDGRQIPVKEHTTLGVRGSSTGTVELWTEEKLVQQASNDNNYLFIGLDREKKYTVKFIPDDTKSETFQKEIEPGSDQLVVFSMDISGSDPADYWKPRYIIGAFVIILINIVGLLYIRRILKEQ